MAVLPYVDILYLPTHIAISSIPVPDNVALIGALPQITNDAQLTALSADSFDTLLTGGLMCPVKHFVADHTLNITNSHSLAALQSLGYRRATLSTELCTAQINDIAVPPGMETELIVYGRSTLMVTEHCSFCCVDDGGCRITENTALRDRKGMAFPIVRDGPTCRVGILNSLPLYMADQLHTLSADVFRMVFTIEKAGQCETVAKHYHDALFHGIMTENPVGAYTHGHYNRGV